MLVDELLATTGAYQIVAAILAAASLAADGGYHVAQRVERQSIAWQLLYHADEISCSGWLLCHCIIKDDGLATAETIAVNPIHYHSVATSEMRRKPPCGHREDSEDVSTHYPS